MLYINNNLKSSVVDISTDPCINYLSVSILLQPKISALISLIYRPPSTSRALSLNALNNLKTLLSFPKFKFFILLGDFNAPNIDWSRHYSNKDSFDSDLLFFASTSSLTQHVRHSTRYRLGCSLSTLDLVFTNVPNSIMALLFFAFFSL